MSNTDYVNEAWQLTLGEVQQLLGTNRSELSANFRSLRKYKLTYERATAVLDMLMSYFRENVMELPDHHRSHLIEEITHYATYVEQYQQPKGTTDPDESADDDADSDLQRSIMSLGTKMDRDSDLQRLIMSLATKMDQCPLGYLGSRSDAVVELVKLLESATPTLKEIFELFHQKLVTASAAVTIEYAKIIRALIEKL